MFKYHSQPEFFQETTEKRKKIRDVRMKKRIQLKVSSNKRYKHYDARDLKPSKLSATGKPHACCNVGGWHLC